MRNTPHVINATSNWLAIDQALKKTKPAGPKISVQRIGLRNSELEFRKDNKWQ